MKKIVIIGGGTAGWLTALYFKKYNSIFDITVIDSTKIGILGAGEGTTPNMLGMLFYLKIDLQDFFEKTKSTKKVGIDFINWSQNKSTFHHGFKKGTHGFHFDARLLAKYFKNIGIERGIKYLDANITHFTQSDNGDITHIHLEEIEKLECDFVFDCSGFARLVIGKLYKSNWKSYSENLKANSALAFFLPQTQKFTIETNTNTQSIAMKNGWMFKIPLQHRWGCGYVFNNDYTTIDEAKKEIEDYIGHEIEIVKSFNFEPGAYQETWVNNCVALGLASGFVEPLEATSLMTLIFSISELGKVGFECSTENRNSYNEYVNDMNNQIVLFITHHYNCGRTDSDFWRDINKLNLPNKLTDVLCNMTKLKSNNDLLHYISPKSTFPIFGYENYMTIDLGHKTKIKKTFL
jgi:tryptophan halogenase